MRNRERTVVWDRANEIGHRWSLEALGSAWVKCRERWPVFLHDVTARVVVQVRGAYWISVPRHVVRLRIERSGSLHKCCFGRTRIGSAGPGVVGRVVITPCCGGSKPARAGVHIRTPPTAKELRDGSNKLSKSKLGPVGRNVAASLAAARVATRRALARPSVPACGSRR
jgi:hypothetical protein